MRQGEPFVETFEIRTLADIEAIEAVPIEQRLEGLDSTYDAIARAAQRSPDAVALAFVPNGDSAAPSHEVTYRELLHKVTQAANAFHALGVGPNDVVSYVLPNLLETHYTIWGGEAAGIVNAVNPMLEPDHIVHILNAVRDEGAGDARAGGRGVALAEGRCRSTPRAEPAQRARRRRGARNRRRRAAVRRRARNASQAIASRAAVASGATTSPRTSTPAAPPGCRRSRRTRI